MGDVRPAFTILTWGCQMNEDDSLQMANLLEQMGYRRSTDESEADVIILNSCSVRAKPEQKVYSKLGELRLMKLERPGLVIGVAGCMAQRDGEKLLKKAPFVDLVIGTASIPELPGLISEAREGRRRVMALDLPETGSNGASHVRRSVGDVVGLKAFVPVMYGCDNFCTYCVVPSARGRERSRLPVDVVAEVTELVERGVREVTLVGQNVNSYGRTLDTPVDFAELLALVDAIPGLERIRFTTSHPKDLSDRLIEAMAALPKVCEHLHLPMQAGDDEILRRMGRKYTLAQYSALVTKLRSRLPGISLSTDIMVGFPGETEEQFRTTLDAVSAVRFDAAFMFAFSARPGTAAARMDDQVDSKTKNRRLRELIDLQNAQTLESNKTRVGTEFEVLVEGPSGKDSSQMSGYTRTNKTVIFPGDPDLKGRLVTVRATAAHPWGFTGELVAE